MLNTGPFYFQLWRKYTDYFGYLFSELHIQREYDNTLGQLIKVPIQYGSKNKQYVRADADPNLAKDTSLTLPRMSYRYTNIRYNPSRKLPSTVQLATINTDDASKLKTQFTPMPFDIDFELYVVVNQQEDGTRIIEQIYPRFTPDLTATLRLIPEMNEERDIPVVYKNTTIEDNFAGDMLQNRIIIYTLQFTMMGYMYGPIVSKPIIEFSYQNYYMGSSGPDGNTVYGDLIEVMEVKPGQLANGSPTTNNSLTVAANQIFANSNYGYIVTSNGMIKLAGN